MLNQTIIKLGGSRCSLGMSVDYYTRLERGKLAGVSDSVLEALARARWLDDAE